MPATVANRSNTVRTELKEVAALEKYLLLLLLASVVLKVFAKSTNSKKTVEVLIGRDRHAWSTVFDCLKEGVREYINCEIFPQIQKRSDFRRLML